MTSDDVTARWASLAKPPGSLGVLEDLVERYAAIRGGVSIDRKAVYVFCADHGVTVEGVSAYPRSVTAAMVANFLRGGAAINVLCRHHAIDPVIIDCGVDAPYSAGTIDCRIGPGTRNFAVEPAMTRDECVRALDNGRQLAATAAERYDIIGLGEMGIGNTTSATALLCAYAGADPAEVTGPGAGLDAAGVSRKASVIASALDLHRGADPLAAFGGFEIATMAGFILGAHPRGLAIMADGLISTAAVLAARAIDPASTNVVLYAHRSAEPGHRAMLDALAARPLLDLSLRLGEGTGAALGIGLLESAIKLHREMATFAEAGISSGNPDP